MKLNFLVVSYCNMGDHAETFRDATEPRDSESLQQFAERIFGANDNALVIEIRPLRQSGSEG